MSAEISCNNTRECNIDGVIKFCYQKVDFRPESNFCDCENWYGWTGTNCDEVSIQLLYYRFALVMFLIWSLVLTFIYTFDISRYVWVYREKKLLKTFISKPVFVTAYL